MCERLSGEIIGKTQYANTLLQLCWVALGGRFESRRRKRDTSNDLDTPYAIINNHFSRVIPITIAQIEAPTIKVIQQIARPKPHKAS